MQEQWKVVDWLDGYSGIMEVSDTGRVRRYSYSYEAIHKRWNTHMTVTKPDILYRPCLTKSGYPEVAVMLNKKRKKFLVHRLVARAFVPGYHPDLTVNHINGIKTDNRASNLEWVTLARNTQHQWEIGLVNLRGDNNPSAKLTSGKVRIIRDLLALGATANQLAVLLDVSSSLIGLIRDGKRWSELRSPLPCATSDNQKGSQEQLV